jgi:hypothetical protein
MKPRQSQAVRSERKLSLARGIEIAMARASHVRPMVLHGVCEVGLWTCFRFPALSVGC